MPERSFSGEHFKGHAKKLLLEWWTAHRPVADQNVKMKMLQSIRIRKAREIYETEIGRIRPGDVLVQMAEVRSTGDTTVEQQENSWVLAFDLKIGPRPKDDVIQECMIWRKNLPVTGPASNGRFFCELEKPWRLGDNFNT